MKELFQLGPECFVKWQQCAISGRENHVAKVASWTTWMASWNQASHYYWYDISWKLSATYPLLWLFQHLEFLLPCSSTLRSISYCKYCQNDGTIWSWGDRFRFGPSEMHLVLLHSSLSTIFIWLFMGWPTLTECFLRFLPLWCWRRCCLFLEWHRRKELPVCNHQLVMFWKRISYRVKWLYMGVWDCEKKPQG